MEVRDRVGRKARLALMTVVLALLSGCTAGGTPGPAGGGALADSPPAGLTGTNTASFELAAQRLDGMDQRTQDEQVRDWAQAGLASLLRLDRAALRAWLYDKTVVRNDLVEDLTRNPVSPGRWLAQDDLLHLLVDAADPHTERTVALLLDDQRTDRGADLPRVQVHKYTVDRAASSITYTSSPVTDTARLRGEHGYVEVPVVTAGDLERFLSRTDHLSRLSNDGGAVVAAGWSWPDTPVGDITLEDLAVLQRAYRDLREAPGFSLDPGSLSDARDLAALAPGAAPAVVDAAWRARSGDAAERDRLANATGLLLFARDEYPRQAAALLAEGYPEDRRQLWALSRSLDGGPAYSMARYDGGLEGTAVGMTLFYTDMVAKDWAAGVGTAVPSEAVPGFQPDSAARTPLGLCSRGAESGRLWFGQRPGAYSYGPTSVDFGSMATRVFVRSGQGGDEVEGSYAFSRGLQWWDRHYQAVADYEPQYHRLDQIMRWSAALEWLVFETQDSLPITSVAGTVTGGRAFADWYPTAGVRETEPVAFVHPPSATQEAILAAPSHPYEDCEGTWIAGGVSLPSSTLRKAQAEFRADLPDDLRRSQLLARGAAWTPRGRRGGSNG